MRPATEWIGDILAAIERIEEQAAHGRAAFMADPLLQVWMQYHLIVIGEAAAQLSRIPGFCERHPKVEWRGMRAMRNVMTHEYFQVDLDEIWTTIEYDIPAAKAALIAIIG